jgi:hypothetical protein
MKTFSKRRNLTATAAAAACLLALVCSRAPATGAAQAPQAERALEDKIPAHVPIKVKVKNLDKEHWARDLEVEVKNTGSKPIYCLNIFIEMPDTLSPAGMPMGFGFKYGRAALGDINERPTPDDVPINPGETYTFRIEEKMLKGWEGFQAEYSANPKKFHLKLSLITFGDGTGFMGTWGGALPSRSATDAPCPTKRAVGGAVARAAGGPPSYLEGRASELPVRSLPAILFLPDRTGGGGTNRRATQSCCDDYRCDKLKVVQGGYNCECGLADKVESVSCRENGGQCGKMAGHQRSCYGTDGTPYFCTDFYVNPCTSMDLE